MNIRNKKVSAEININGIIFYASYSYYKDEVEVSTKDGYDFRAKLCWELGGISINQMSDIVKKELGVSSG